MKSNASDYIELATLIYKDACAKCPADVSDLRDLKTIESRVMDEGISFLTITLPNFASAIEHCLAIGYIDPSFRSTLFRGFSFNGSIPAFLQGMIGLVFDHETGRIYDESFSTFKDHPQILESVRQICLSFKKIELSCTPERVQKAIDGFVEIERSFDDFSPTQEELVEFRSVSSVLWDSCIYDLRHSMLIPKHGPGATAERVSGNRKYDWVVWHKRLDNYFPLFETAYPIGAIDSEEVKSVSFVPEELEQPVRVTPVPKTLKAPRIIAIEPCCMQYAQQGIRSIIYDLLESYELTAGHINFRDQSVNQNQAISGSIDGQLATIDLSDASDRVPRDLALEMFRAYPEFKDAIDACRSTKAELPDGRIIGPLRKFASMGSALCFPVESMYFYTICVAALLWNRKLSVSRRNVFLVTRDIYVYGDDLIVPVDDAGTVLDYLQKYNCKVNTRKSFWSGNFRESCGVDAYRGKLVTPVYIRRQRPESRQQASELISWSRTANLFFKKGYYRTAEFMHNMCERVIGLYPDVPDTSSALGRTYPVGSDSHIRVNRRTQSLEIKAWVPTPVYRIDKLEGYAALMKSFLKLESRKGLPVVRNVLLEGASWQQDIPAADDPLHLERSALYGAVTLKLRWVRAS